jgi:hypothetical protein
MVTVIDLLAADNGTGMTIVLRGSAATFTVSVSFSDGSFFDGGIAL